LESAVETVPGEGIALVERFRLVAVESSADCWGRVAGVGMFGPVQRLEALGLVEVGSCNSAGVVVVEAGIVDIVVPEAVDPAVVDTVEAADLVIAEADIDNTEIVGV
jgi:hypothetical protein